MFSTYTVYITLSDLIQVIDHIPHIGHILRILLIRIMPATLHIQHILIMHLILTMHLTTVILHMFLILIVQTMVQRQLLMEVHGQHCQKWKIFLLLLHRVFLPKCYHRWIQIYRLKQEVQKRVCKCRRIPHSLQIKSNQV